MEQPNLTVIPKATHHRGVPILDLLPGDPVPTEPGAFAVFTSDDLATYLMERYADPEKRTIREAKVIEMLADMEADRWWWGTSNVIFTENGRTKLGNGHHRLTANGRCSKIVPHLFITGAEDETRAVTDIGQTRSAADVIRMAGGDRRYASDIGSAAKMLLIYRQTAGTNTLWRPGPENYRYPTKPGILDAWLGDNARWVSACRVVSDARKYLPRGLPWATLRAFAYLAESEHPDEGTDFIRRVSANEVPVLYRALVEASKRMRFSGSGSQLEAHRWFTELMIRAYNADRSADEAWAEPRGRFTLSRIA